MSTIYDLSTMVNPVSTVSISNNQGRLRAEFKWQGKKRYLVLGVPATEEGYKHANTIKTQIENDMVNGTFVLDNLKSYRLLSTADRLNPSLKILWGKFIDFKTKTCNEQTMYSQYNVYTNHLNKLPTYDLRQAETIRDWCLDNLTIDTCKRFITRLSACCDYGMETGMIGFNPFTGMAQRIGRHNRNLSKPYEDINPFTAEERDRILAAIKSDQFTPKKSAYKDSHYYPFIAFLFFTGARVNEVTPLTIGDVNLNRKVITFRRSLIRTEDGKKITEGTKTGKSRIFPMNDRLLDIVNGQIRGNVNDCNCLLFPGYKGKVIDANNVRNRMWKRVLDGLGIEYRKLYATRSTFITLALENGVEVKTVARLVGNSPTVIYEHYAGVNNIANMTLPEF